MNKIYQKIEASFYTSEISEAISISLSSLIENLCKRLSTLNSIPPDVKENAKRIWLLHCDTSEKNTKIKNLLHESLIRLDAKEENKN